MLSSPPRSSSDLAFFSPPKISKSGALTTSAVVVTTRLARRPVVAQRSSSATSNQSVLPPSSPRSSLGSSPLSSPPSPSRKRKSLPKALSAVCTEASDLPRAVKRLRTASNKEKAPKRKNDSTSKNSSRAASRQRTLPPSPEAIYRSSRSRSTSLFPAAELERPIRSRRWCNDEDGTPGENHLSSEIVVKRLMKSYKSYFKNPNDRNDTSFDPHPTNYPVVELEYPNTGASERFILLAPKDKDHYNPIMDLERSLYTIVECYLTEEQQALFGPIPSATLSEVVSPPASPSPSPPCSNASSASTSSLSSLSSSNSSSLTSLSSTSSLSTVDRLPVLRAVQRAIHLQDGPLFMLAMKRVNFLLHSLKYPDVHPDPSVPLQNTMMAKVESWTDKGIPDKVSMRIIEENYQRAVGPNVPSLKQYEAFSSTVYGELMPSLVEEMIRFTDLHEGSLFLDLGSGVGNVVVQASLQTGCTSYGIELMHHPARVARDMMEQMKIRCRMWGVRVGEMELEEGNMLESKRVDELIAKADVVLVDNKVFEESLNEALRPKFLDLKEGAFVISLSPFVSSINARLTKRNVDDMSAIFDVQEKPYHSGSVSWGNNGGNYYLHKVDRKGYAKIKERFDNLHGGSSRSSRSRSQK